MANFLAENSPKDDSKSSAQTYIYLFIYLFIHSMSLNTCERSPLPGKII